MSQGCHHHRGCSLYCTYLDTKPSQTGHEKLYPTRLPAVPVRLPTTAASSSSLSPAIPAFPLLSRRSPRSLCLPMSCTWRQASHSHFPRVWRSCHSAIRERPGGTLRDLSLPPIHPLALAHPFTLFPHFHPPSHACTRTHYLHTHTHALPHAGRGHLHLSSATKSFRTHHTLQILEKKRKLNFHSSVNHLQFPLLFLLLLLLFFFLFFRFFFFSSLPPPSTQNKQPFARSSFALFITPKKGE